MDTSIDVGELAEEAVRITREMRRQLDAARAEANGLRLQNGLLRQEHAAALARAEKAEAALRAIVREYNPATATHDWKAPDDFAEFCNEQALAALALVR